MIYWIGNNKSGPVKIGFTSSALGAEARLSSLQTGNPQELSVLGWIDGTQRGESRIHQTLSKHRLKGEWFERKPALALLDGFKNGDLGSQDSTRGLHVRAGRRNGTGSWTGELSLYWEPNGAPISGGYTPHEISAEDLFHIWQREYVPQNGIVPIYWSVVGDCFTEAAPVGNTGRRSDIGGPNYYTDYHHPFDASGQVISWLDLPVQDQHWNERDWGGAGFIQELTGWKPSPFQQHMDVHVVLQAWSIQG